MSTKPGYVLAVGDGYIPGAIHIERDDELWLYPDDCAAARAAEADGINLIYGMSGIPDGVYVDTPSNRALLHRHINSNQRQEDRNAHFNSNSESEL